MKLALLLANVLGLVGAKEYDVVVVGGGAAGLQAALYLQEVGLSHVVVDRATSAGDFWSTFPRSGQLISFNKRWTIYDDPEVNLRWDWNSLLTDKDGTAFPFRNFSKKLYPDKEEMSRYLEAFHAKYTQRSVQYGFEVQAGSLKRRQADDLFELTGMLSAGMTGPLVADVATGQPHTMTARRVIVATGNGKQYTANIPGIELCETYGTAPWDADSFEGQSVLVIGKGNAAFELADLLLPVTSIVQLISPHSLRLAWQTRHPGHARANNFELLDAYQLKLLSGLLDATIHKIENVEGEDGLRVTLEYSHADGEVEVLRYDRVIAATGFAHDTSLYDQSTLPSMETEKTNGRYPQITPAFESVNVPGMFFAGTIAQVRDFRKAGSAFVDGFRYNVRSMVRWIANEFPQSDRSEPYRYPHKTISVVSEDGESSLRLYNALSERINRNSALWTQFNFLGDLVVLDPAGCDELHTNDSGHAAYYRELPLDLIHETVARGCNLYLTLEFNWGETLDDVMEIERHPEPGREDYRFLHPILRLYRSTPTGPETKVQLWQHHVVEDLFGTYRHDGPGAGTRETDHSILIKRQGRNSEDYHAEFHDRPLQEFVSRALTFLENPVKPSDPKLADKENHVQSGGCIL